jgi:hypothetical protein
MTPKKAGPQCRVAATSKYTAGSSIWSARSMMASKHMRPNVDVQNGDLIAGCFIIVSFNQASD